MPLIIPEKCLCQYCGVQCLDDAAFQQHINGKKHKKQVAKVEKEEAEAKAAEERKLAEENGELPPEEQEPVAEGKEDPPAKVLRAKRRKEKWLEKRKYEPTSSDHGPSAQSEEYDNITAKLEKLGYKLVDVPADGHCLFRALIHQLSLRGIQYPTDVGHLVIRKQTVKQIRSHPEIYSPFIDTETCSFEEYCNKMENTGEWGGDIELTAFSDSIKCPIEIYNINDTIKIGEQYKDEPLKLVILYHAISSGPHYNSMQPISK